MRKVDAANRDARRRQALDAAVACFRRKGFAATTIADICREAGMSPGHLYHYFESKDEIVAAVAQSDRAQASAVVRGLADAPDFIEALIAASAGDVDLGDYALDGSLALELHGEATRSESVAMALKTNYRALQQSLRDAITVAQQRACVDPSLDPTGAAILITALYDGIERAAACDPQVDVAAAGRTLSILLRRFLSPVGQAADSLTRADEARPIRVRRNKTLV